MIIRGGENISPSAIESALNKVPGLAALNIQIVGAVDTIAGEVPIAVTNRPVDAEIGRKIRDTILKTMGTIYTPDEVVSLETLGLKDFPKTLLGKMQKTKLTEVVCEYRRNLDAPVTNGHGSQMAENVKRIWARAVGLTPEKLRLQDPITDFADSITVMRVKDKIKKELGVTISLAEMAETDTLEKQIQLIEARPAEKGAENIQRVQKITRKGGPEPEDMVHLTEDPDLFEGTKDAVEAVIEPYRLSWDDVAEVIPVYDFASVLAETRIFDTWNFKMALLPKQVDEKVRLFLFRSYTRTDNVLATSEGIRDDIAEQSHACLLLRLGGRWNGFQDCSTCYYQRQAGLPKPSH